MRKYDNENGASGVVAGVMIFVIIVVGALGFLMITDAFETQYTSASADPLNSTGIYLNNTTPYQGVHTITKGVTDNIPVAIFLALLLAIILVVLAVWAILKRGD
jgi:hypothetical protein